MFWLLILFGFELFLVNCVLCIVDDDVLIIFDVRRCNV